MNHRDLNVRKNEKRQKAAYILYQYQSEQIITIGWLLNSLHEISPLRVLCKCPHHKAISPAGSRTVTAQKSVLQPT